MQSRETAGTLEQLAYILVLFFNTYQTWPYSLHNTKRENKITIQIPLKFLIQIPLKECAWSKISYSNVDSVRKFCPLLLLNLFFGELRISKINQ